MNGTLRQRNPYFSSPESKVRHAWVTLSRIFVARGCSTTLSGNTSAPFCRPRVQYDTFRRHFSPFSLPKGARQNDVRMNGTPRQRNPYFSSPECKVRHAWVTLPSIFVARECSTTRLGNTVAHFRRPRVQHDTFRRHFSPFSLPKGARQNDVRMKGTLRQRNPYFSSPECKVRHAWVTLPRIFVARGCSTTLSGDTSAHFRCRKVQGRMT